jgi:hypothetical protein
MCCSRRGARRSGGSCGKLRCSPSAPFRSACWRRRAARTAILTWPASWATCSRRTCRRRSSSSSSSSCLAAAAQPRRQRRRCWQAARSGWPPGAALAPVLSPAQRQRVLLATAEAAGSPLFTAIATPWFMQCSSLKTSCCLRSLSEAAYITPSRPDTMRGACGAGSRRP